MNMLNNYINGEWVASLGRESTEVVNPATGELLAKCPLGTEDDVDRAVAAAADAFKIWRQTPVIDRVQPLFRFCTRCALREERRERGDEEFARRCEFEEPPLVETSPSHWVRCHAAKEEPS